MTSESPKTAEAAEASKDVEQSETAEPLNREQRRALARGKKGATGKKSIGSKKSNVRSQLPNGGVGKFQLPTKNG